MSKASDVLLDLAAEPLTPEQIKLRRQAEQARTDLVATPTGELVDRVSTNTAPEEVWKAKPRTID